MTGYTEMETAPAVGGRPGIIATLALSLASANQRATIARDQLFEVCVRLGLSVESTPPRDENHADLPGEIAAAHREIGDLLTTLDGIDNVLVALNRL